MAFYSFDPNDFESLDKMRSRMSDIFSPAILDQQVRQAIKYCWMMLPGEKRNLDELENQIRRLVDRALKNLREDEQAFWKDPDKQ